jgi:hypothetical protein
MLVVAVVLALPLAMQGVQEVAVQEAELLLLAVVVQTQAAVVVVVVMTNTLVAPVVQV